MNELAVSYEDPEKGWTPLERPVQTSNISGKYPSNQYTHGRRPSYGQRQQPGYYAQQGDADDGRRRSYQQRRTSQSYKPSSIQEQADNEKVERDVGKVSEKESANQNVSKSESIEEERDVRES